MTVVVSDPARSNTVGAVLWMSGALVSFSIIAVAGREAGRHMPTTEIMFWRALMGVAILVAIMPWRGGGAGGLRSGQPWLHGGRAIVQFVAQWSWLHALTLIPLVQLFALEFTAPLWVAVLAPLLLGERLTWARLTAAGLGFLGAMIVVRPGAVGISFGSVLALTAALGFALNMIITKQLTKTDSAFTILFWMNALQLVIGLPFMLDGIAWPGAVTWAWVAAIGVCGLTAHYSMARAFALADAIIVAPMDFLRLPLIALIGVLAYNEALDPLLLVGAALVICANGVNIWSERRGGG